MLEARHSTSSDGSAGGSSSQSWCAKLNQAVTFSAVRFNAAIANPELYECTEA